MSTKFAKELLDAMNDSWSKYTTVQGHPEPARSPRRSAPGTTERHARHVPRRSPSSRTSTRTCTRSTRCSPRSTRAASTSSGASATSSATGRARTSASPLLRERAALCLAGNHDLVVLGRIPLATFAGEAAAAASWTRGVLDDAARASSARSSRARRCRRRALPRQPARPGLGLRPRPRTPRRWTLAATSAPLVLVGHSHVALELVGRRRRRYGAARRRPARASTSARRGGCSTRARSASRATATRAPPGS